MIALTEFAPAKINLALHILGRRADGFHEIDSIVAFADVGDELRFEPASEFTIIAAGPFANDLPAPENNIIFAAWKAAAAIAAARGLNLPPAAVKLTKNLPIAAGIGGGSADAAAALRGFLWMAEIKMIDAEIARAALTLGADVPACLSSRACRMQGIGERLTALDDFKALHAVLINPLIAVQTSNVFQKLGLAASENRGTSIAHLSTAAAWRNDLMASAVTLVPVIADVIAALEKQQHLRFARMSGSGATCFGVFESAAAARNAAGRLAVSFPRWWVRQSVLH